MKGEGSEKRSRERGFRRQYVKALRMGKVKDTQDNQHQNEERRDPGETNPIKAADIHIAKRAKAPE
jgi:hypothetical protein